MTQKPTNYLAIAFIMGGSSWASGPDVEGAVEECAKTVSRDWGSIYKMDDTPLNVAIYDLTGCEDGWYADIHGVFTKGAHEPVPYLQTEKATVPPYKRGR